MLECLLPNLKQAFRFLDQLRILNLSRNDFGDELVIQLSDTLKEIP